MRDLSEIGAFFKVWTKITDTDILSSRTGLAANESPLRKQIIAKISAYHRE